MLCLATTSVVTHVRNEAASRGLTAWAAPVILEHSRPVSQGAQASNSGPTWPNRAIVWTHESLDSNHISSLQLLGRL